MNMFRTETLQLGEQSCEVILEGEGPLVVCLHGFPDHPLSYRHQIPALVEAGYQVACPFLPGYDPGFQRPDGRYDLLAVSDSLLELVEALRRRVGRPDEPVHLIGHDWGALSGFAMVCRAPQLFRSFTSLSIPYNISLTRVLTRAPGYLPHSWYIQLFQLPFIAEAVLALAGWSMLDHLYDRWSQGWVMPADVRAAIRDNLARPGVRRAALAYYRAIYGLSANARASMALLNKQILVPSLLLAGRYDGAVPLTLWRLTDPASFPMGLRQGIVDAGHFFHQEKPEEVNAILLEWLASQDKPSSEPAKAGAKKSRAAAKG